MKTAFKRLQKRVLIDTRGFLEAVGDGLFLLQVSGRYRYVYMQDGMAGVHRMVQAEERLELNRKLCAARRRGLIAESRLGTRLEIALTDRGRESLDRMRLRTCGRLPAGSHVYVMYDIPERRRSLRDKLRTLLKRVGFRQYQRSVWRTDKDVSVLMKAWIVRHKLEKWVDMYET